MIINFKNLINNYILKDKVSILKCDKFLSRNFILRILNLITNFNFNVMYL